MKKLFLLLNALLFISVSIAQIPSGYYDQAQGKTGASLKTELYTIIKDHSVQSYTPGVWNAFYTTDIKSNGKVWDMYSNFDWTFGNNQCGTYSGEGSCYNREHSFPKSWFGDVSPMNTDLFHIYPTDGYVNGKRGNYPFGEVSNASWTSTNGSKVGSNSLAGYSGTVFEPIDEYKGDFARTYFYMATRYENVISNWNSDVLNGSTYPVYTEWQLDMLISWHEQDPVSQKETDRNNAVYAIQHNRNPFIDHPEYVASVWGTASTSPNIGNVYNLPLEPSATEVTTIYATITDNGTITSAKLEWGLSSSALSNQLTMQANGDIYSADIPAQAEGVSVYYTITAVDDESESSTTSVYTYTVYIPAGPIVLPVLEDFEDGDLGIFSAVSVVGADETWHRYTYATTGNSFAKMSGFNNGTVPNEDWLITAPIDFDSYSDESLSFKTSMNYADATTVFHVLYSDNYSGEGDPNSADWINITGEADLSVGNYDWVESGTIDLSELIGENAIAFKYVCTTESETWQLDDIAIGGTPVQTGIDDVVSANQLRIFPNPANSWIQFTNSDPQEATILIYNYLGQLKFEEKLKLSPNYKMDIDFLNAGIYILQLNNTDGKIQNFRLVVK